MSIQWTLIAGFLYFEIAVTSLMILPILSPRRWHRFFKSRLFALVRDHASFYFFIFLGVLCLFLLDAIKEMRKYSHTDDPSHVHLSMEMKGSIKLFRAQRNFYITGFAIFLYFVIRRLVTMLIIQDELTLKAEMIIKEAENTVNLAKTTVIANTIHENEIKELKELKNQLEKTESLLQEEKERVNELQEEVEKWRLKYEAATTVEGKGDQ